ncbi:MAG: serine/threonine protein phosphatase [Gammaproteobacteria bacterium]|nr:serine/threonine protein phosphatase [Gammaproteobacteria bacterium]
MFRDPISELGTYVSVIENTQEAERITTRRCRALQHLGEIFGGPIKPLPPEQALDTLQQVNELLRKEPYRPLDSYGNIGGLLNLPKHLTPIVVGDLHAQTENLLKILSENMYLEALEKGDAALIILGDAVHPEGEDELSYMDSSILIMDMILKLKLRFPDNVFMILGNHDSFSLDVMKGGIPQGLLWEKRVIATRGETYRDAMELFYRQLPLVVISEHFVACHAGPPRGTPSREMLVDVRRYPNLFRELTWTRVKTPRFPAGYTRGDVRRFRKALGISENIPFIVAHYPLSREDTIWLNVIGIPRHHIVFSALPEQMGIFTRIDNEMVAQIYPAENLSPWVNQTQRDS